MKSFNKRKNYENEFGVLVVGENKEHPFPYNLMKIRAYLKETGKSLDEVTYNELLPFALKDRLVANH